MMQQNISPFILTRRKKRLLMRATLMMYLNQSILQFYETCKKSLEKKKTQLYVAFEIMSMFMVILKQEIILM